MGQWLGIIIDIGLLCLILMCSVELRRYRLRLNVMEALLKHHHDHFPIIRRLLVLHHAHFYHEEKEEQFIWPATNESTETD